MITIFIECDGEDYELLDNLTIGRHLDNDLVIAGEDILDYHARLERVDRGVKVHPLLDATVSLGQQDFSTPVNLTPLDNMTLGQTQLRIRVQDESSISTAGWSLRHVGGARTVIDSSLSVGRAEDAGLTLEDDHISRYHAMLTVQAGAWLQDLRSANGTFVNGERVVGGVRLFHGDLLGIDTHRFQVCCDGEDLTPIKPFDPLPPKPMANSTQSQNAPAPDITEFGVEAPQPVADLGSLQQELVGAYLLGASEPVQGQVFPLQMGTTTVGHDPRSSVVLEDASVSAQHAQLMLRAEGLSITNLIATNGTKVNGEPVTTVTLQPGDRLTLGRVHLVYQHKAQPPSLSKSRVSWVILAASLIVAGILTWFW
jgi:pSer/pThr/pTyr-binding forkhead associated (FHA) protein